MSVARGSVYEIGEVVSVQSDVSYSAPEYWEGKPAGRPGSGWSPSVKEVGWRAWWGCSTGCSCQLCERSPAASTDWVLTLQARLLSPALLSCSVTDSPSCETQDSGLFSFFQKYCVLDNFYHHLFSLEYQISLKMWWLASEDRKTAAVSADKEPHHALCCRSHPWQSHPLQVHLGNNGAEDVQVLKNRAQRDTILIKALNGKQS